LVNDELLIVQHTHARFLTPALDPVHAKVISCQLEILILTQQTTMSFIIDKIKANLLLALAISISNRWSLGIFGCLSYLS
jgi:hypothetical protein